MAGYNKGDAASELKVLKHVKAGRRISMAAHDGAAKRLIERGELSVVRAVQGSDPYAHWTLALTDAGRVRLEQQKTSATVVSRESRAEALALRSQGKTFSEIGAALGVNPTRARAIVIAQEKALQTQERSPKTIDDDTLIEEVAHLLGGRAANGLRNLGVTTVGQARCLSDEVLLAAPRLGAASLAQIRGVLND